MPVFVGISQYPGRTFGKRQVSGVRPGLQCNMMLAAARAAGHDIRVNEANRSRPDQQLMWDQRHILGVVVAFPFTSKHDGGWTGNDGEAFDFGKTGGYALTQSDLNWLHANAPLYGITPTGLSFSSPESWHFEQNRVPVIVASSVWKTPDADLLAAARKRRAAAAALKAAQAKARAEIIKRKKVGMGFYVESKDTGAVYDEHEGGYVKRVNDTWGKRVLRAAYGFAPQVISGKAIRTLLDDRKAGRIRIAKEAAAASGVTDIAATLASIESEFEAMKVGEVGEPGPGDDA